MTTRSLFGAELFEPGLAQVEQQMMVQFYLMIQEYKSAQNPNSPNRIKAWVELGRSTVRLCGQHPDQLSYKPMSLGKKLGLGIHTYMQNSFSSYPYEIPGMIAYIASTKVDFDAYSTELQAEYKLAGKMDERLEETVTYVTQLLDVAMEEISRGEHERVEAERAKDVDRRRPRRYGE